LNAARNDAGAVKATKEADRSIRIFNLQQVL